MKLPRPERPARALSDVVDLAGLACLDGAAWLLHPAAGLVVLGGILLLIGWVIDQ